MAKIHKEFFTQEELETLKEYYYEKENNLISIRDKDLSVVDQIIRTRSIAENKTDNEILNRSYVLKVSTMLLKLIVDTEMTPTDKFACISAINSLYLISQVDAERLLNVLRNNI